MLATREKLFVTGGYVCQQVYQKEWDSDIDIWFLSDKDDVYPAKDDTHSKKTNLGLELDVVATTKEPHLCIEGFDISLCSFGYYYDTKEIWCTLDALYTYYTGIVSINMDKGFVDYVAFEKTSHEGGYELRRRENTKENYIRRRLNSKGIRAKCQESEDYPVPFQDYYQEHLQNNHIADWWRCDECSQGTYRHELHRWKERVRKYEDRFPTFIFVL